MPIILYAMMGLIVFGVVALLLTPNLFRPSPEAQRITPTLRVRRAAANDAAEPPAKKPASGVQSPAQPPAVVAGLKA